MRLATAALAAFAVLASATVASAQQSSGPAQRQREREARDQAEEQQRAPRLGRLRAVPNAGPCPFVKILYDAARYVELEEGRTAASAVGYTGEIEGVTAGCAYQSDEPITVQANILFNLGRGPQAGDDRRTYRYWIAVTERNEAVLAKEYFDLPVDFDGQRTASVEQGQTVVIPRATAETSGGNFEVLIGFDVTPEMADFNRSGSRFRINAGTASAATPPAE
ncbi:Tat pathway signal sequence domain protein [Brevundimonas aurifodinae]|uniref:Tat pathway signal sequence domain protein n=2 Tax=Brevundimonas TaxID=41275 RepID=A0ABV1NLH1_9CAUL|nr:MAG: Tat pathway signal sequence domain protein [Brevundimonas sp. 12-68-7]OYX33600.1 MAG: Tat pathway signal sequence domain protein [Brevundimonas subvibrioides]